MFRWINKKSRIQKFLKFCAVSIMISVTELGITIIRGGPKRMQRFWSVISTTLLIEYRWFLLYWIEYSFPSNLTPSSSSMDRAFDSRAIFLRHCHFQNVLLFPPQAGLKQLEFSATKLRNECLAFIHIVFLFKVRAIMLLFCQHSSWFWNKFQLLQACLRGKSGTFSKWHCLRTIALESKRLIHTLWTWCQITWKRILYPIKQKLMVFNQECRWNNGSKSLHSFWATPYTMNYSSTAVYGGKPMW